MKVYCLTLDLRDDPEAIRAYDDHHKNVWPEVLQSLTDSGILAMQIYRFHNRLFMRIETLDDFTFERKAEMDLANPKVQEWEKLMENYQQALPSSDPDWRWVLMDQVFDFRD